MSEKILSISVAAYNLGEMLRENLASFCAADCLDKLEIIVTDDGSRDNTPDIAEEFAAKYPDTVKLIRQPNQGPGSTVNSGLAHATGKYFRMVDGDDWVNTDALEGLVALLCQTDADMVVADYEIYSDTEKKVIDRISAGIETGRVYSFAEAAPRIPYQMHAITYKTDLFRNVGLKLDNGFYTDTEYTLFPIPAVKTVAALDLPVYVYRVARAGQSVNEESMRRNVDKHLAILNRQLEVYNAAKATLPDAHRDFIAARIAKIADVQLGTYLLFDKSREAKAKVVDLIRHIKQSDPRVYHFFSQSKKCKLLTHTHCLAYPLARHIMLKKGRKEY